MPELPGVPLLFITDDPQPVVSGNSQGVTLINPGTTPIVLSTDPIPSASNSFVLQPNGASLPIATGPLWASVTSGMGTLNIFPGILNVSNPNVLVTNAATSTEIVNTNASIVSNVAEEAFTVPSGIKTLGITIFSFSNNPVTNVLVTRLYEGVSLGGPPQPHYYYNNPPYLEWLGGVGELLYDVVVPIEGETDGTIAVTVTFTLATGSAGITVNGYYDRFKESDFYNGPIQSAQANAIDDTVTILNGPARLLTAYVMGGGGSLASINISGSAAIMSVVGALFGTISFPSNTILPSGKSITISGNAPGVTVNGGVSYAYP